jgi:hypothetical protein
MERNYIDTINRPCICYSDVLEWAMDGWTYGFPYY